MPNKIRKGLIGFQLNPSGNPATSLGFQQSVSQIDYDVPLTIGMSPNFMQSFAVMNKDEKEKDQNYWKNQFNQELNNQQQNFNQNLQTFANSFKPQTNNNIDVTKYGMKDASQQFSNDVQPITNNAQSKTSQILTESTNLGAQLLGKIKFGGSKVDPKSTSPKSLSFSDKFNNSTFGKNFGAWSAGLDMADNLLTGILGEKSEYAGERGEITRTLDNVYDNIADGIANVPVFGQMASLIMKGGKALGTPINKLGGGTDGMTSTDAILGSAFFNLTPIGLINGFGGQKSETITKNEEAFEQVGASYGGSNQAVNAALQKSGKKYGLLSAPGRRAANKEILEARRQQGIIEDIADTSRDQFSLMNSMSAINSNRRAMALQGGYKQEAVRAGKQGMAITKNSIISEIELLPITTIEEIILNDTLPEFKSGGIIAEIQLSSIINEIELFAEGGSIEEPANKFLDYAYDRFPILKNLDNIELYYDKDFQPKTIGDYGDLEYIQSKHDNLPYYNNYSKPEDLKGKSVIIYNDNVTDEDVALDMISHGLREYDPKYLELIDNLLDNDDFYEAVFNEGFPRFSKMEYKDYQKLSDKQKKSLLRKFEKSEEFTSAIDGIIRALLVKDELSEKLRYNYSKKFIDNLKDTNEWKAIENYIFNKQVDSFKEGGQFNVIPEGALHARLHHMEDDENITKKGIPVVSKDKDGNIEQQAEIEREEIIFRLSVTKHLEELAKEDTDKAAIEAGKLLVQEILYNTIDNTNNLL